MAPPSSLATLNISNSGDVTYLAVPVRIATPTLHHEPLQPLRESPSPTPGVLDLPPPLLVASIEAATQTSMNSSLESVIQPALQYEALQRDALQCDNVLDAIDVVDTDAVRGNNATVHNKKFATKVSTNSITHPKSILGLKVSEMEKFCCFFDIFFKKCKV